MSVADQLLGTWKLVENVNFKGTEESRPFGEKPRGQLQLHPDGHVSVLMFRPELPRFAAGNRLMGTDEENRQVVQGCLAVGGKWQLAEDGQTLILTAEVSTYPNLVGVAMRRPFRLEGDLQTWHVQEATVGGSSKIVWRRASE